MERLRVATLNIWNRSGPWDARKVLLQRGIDELAPDLLGLQEVLNLDTGELVLNQAAELIDERPLHHVYGVGHMLKNEMAKGLSFGNALVSRFPILEHSVHELPGGERSDQTRSVLHAVVEAPFGPVNVFVTHLNWKLHEGHLRLQQIRFITDLVMQRCPTKVGGYPPILMGDLNAEPGSDEIRWLYGHKTIDDASVYFADAWRYEGQGPGYTFDPKNPYAAQVHEPPRRIDYVFVRGPDGRGRGKPSGTRLCFCEPTAGVWPTDHFGVVTDLAT